LTDLPTLYSGAAAGADSAFMKYAEEFGFPQVHFVVNDNKAEHCKYLSYSDLAPATSSVQKAANRLGKNFPRKTFVWKLIHRNWFQVQDSSQMFAVGTLAPSMDNVQGGTGWAVAMAIECTDIAASGNLFVYDQTQNSWYIWNAMVDKFVPGPPSPCISGSFAGIGSRALTEHGDNEIRLLLQRSAEKLSAN